MDKTHIADLIASAETSIPMLLTRSLWLDGKVTALQLQIVAMETMLRVALVALLESKDDAAKQAAMRISDLLAGSTQVR